MVRRRILTLRVFIMSFALMTGVRSFKIVQRVGRIERTARFHQKLFLSASATDRPRRQPKQSSNTGGLRRLPVVKAPDELAARASKAARKVKADRCDNYMHVQCIWRSKPLAST